MRKIIIFVLTLGILLMMSACDTNHNEDIVNCSNHKNNESMAATSSNNSDPDTLLNNGNSEHFGISSQIKYMTFEETLASATNIVIATYTGVSEECGIYHDLIFLPERQIKGSGIDREFHVRVCDQIVTVADTDIQYFESVEKYVQGEKYVLILEKQVSVYNSFDLYVPLNNVLIEEGKIPTMYDGTTVNKFTGEQKNIRDIDSAISYIDAFLLKGVDTSKVAGTDFIRSDDLTEVVNKSSVVAEVVPIELTGNSENNNTERYMCSVQNVLKGVIPETNIKIIFVSGSVELGKKYTVMIEKLGSSEYYILSSKISVYDSEDEASEQVKNIIEDSLLS